jgi:hypothetical protein
MPSSWMLFLKEYPTGVAIVLFWIVFGGIHALHPAWLFDSRGALRPFGIGTRRHTFLPSWLLALVLAILCYAFVRWGLSHV